MKIPSSVGSKGFPAWPLAPPRMLMPSFSPGRFSMEISCQHRDTSVWVGGAPWDRGGSPAWTEGRGGVVSFSTSIPGGGGSRLTTICSSGVLESRALTAS